MRVAVLSDTHAPRHWKTMPVRVAEIVTGVDLILHAGDVCAPQVLDELAAFAPVRVVLGNNDGSDIAAWGAPEKIELDLDGLARWR
ncbi:MAG: metallophosphoesterase family protein [Nocardioidaceae bacterium]